MLAQYSSFLLSLQRSEILTFCSTQIGAPDLKDLSFVAFSEALAHREGLISSGTVCVCAVSRGAMAQSSQRDVQQLGIQEEMLALYLSVNQGYDSMSTCLHSARATNVASKRP